MKLFFYADGRSPTALNWIGYFISSGHSVHLASSYPAEPVPGLASFRVIPAAFSGAAAGSSSVHGGYLRRLISPQLRTAVRQRFAALTIRSTSRRLAEAIRETEPELVHAMRIPYEGMASAQAIAELSGAKSPLLISIWGNDFTLHARSNSWMAKRTKSALKTAGAIHADCRRDIRLAREWGFPEGRPFTVLPGGGGVQTDLFYPAGGAGGADAQQPMTIIQPRGARAYVQNDAFFQAIPLVLEKHAGVRFVCPALAGEKSALHWMENPAIRNAVTLLPRIPREEMAAWFRRSAILVSATTHDGTPNTLLEGLACGCFPVAGDLESIREWITQGENGLLVDPTNPESIAGGLIAAIGDTGLRSRAREINLGLIREQADYAVVMRNAEMFYAEITTART